MAKLVFAGAMTHTAQMVRSMAAIPPEQQDAVRRGLAALAAALRETRPEVLIVIGADHFSTFFPANMPAFCIGTGLRSHSWGDGGVPEYDVPIHGAVARALLGALLEAGFDLASAYNMPLDHGYACPLHFLAPGMDIPVVPIFINCAAPPLPVPRRAYRFGCALGEAIAALDGGLRVAVLGTGGLSHWVPIADPERPKDALDRRMIEMMRREDGAGVRLLMRERVDAWGREGKGMVGQAFDETILDAFATGRGAELTRFSDAWIEAQGGNGGHELRTWLAAAGAAGDRGGEVVLYESVPRWLTGIAMFRWRVD